jgi:hypothetical protein
MARRKLGFADISLAVKLFHRRNGSAKPAPTEAEPTTAALEHQLESQDILSECTPPPPAPSAMIALSAEQKTILEKPLDPRVDRILHELHSDRTAAENALKARRIIQFPQNDWASARVVQDENGFWRIVPGAALEQDRAMVRFSSGSITI